MDTIYTKPLVELGNSKTGIGQMVKKPFALSLLCIFRDTNLDEYVSFAFPTAPPDTHNCCLDL